MKRPVGLALAFVLLAGPASASPPAASGFLSRHSGSWRVIADPVTGAPALVYGGRLAQPARPVTAEEYEAAARTVLAAESDLFDVPDAALQLAEVKALRFSDLGGTDKTAVVFRQEVEGLPVENGSLAVLFDAASGDVLALDSTAVPGTSVLDVVPRTGAAAAAALAQEAFLARFSFPADRVHEATPVIVGRSFFDLDHPTAPAGAALAWRIGLEATGRTLPGDLPATAAAWVAADGSGVVFDLRPTACSAIQGRVTGNFTLGGDPNTPANAQQVGLANVVVRHAGPHGKILATTDANGAYAINHNGPLPLFVRLQGPWFTVNSVTTPTLFAAFNATAQNAANVDLNANWNQFDAAQVAAAHWIDAFRGYIKGIDGADKTMDFQVLCNVNTALLCNAFWTGNPWGGNSIVFFVGGKMHNGPVCANTAYRSGLHHEEGHWANARYNGTPSPAFHEGVADAWSYYVNDDECFWKDLKGPGTGCVRTGDQIAVKKCAQDGSEKCAGPDPHEMGKAIASALWKTKRNLEATHGAGPGGAIADRLFLSWLQAFNDQKILNVVLDHWLVLDDDDGDLANGTPHQADIVAAFVEQGWPTPGAFESYGAGCAGTGGNVPVLSVTGSGKQGTTQTFLVTNAKPKAAGALWISLAADNKAVAGGCTQLVKTPLSSAVNFVTDRSGTAVLTLPAPVATIYYVQAAVSDTGNPSGAALSNGVKLTIAP